MSQSRAKGIDTIVKIRGLYEKVSYQARLESVHSWLYLGYPCAINLGGLPNTWCGYVGLEPGHYAHGVTGVTNSMRDCLGNLTYAEYDLTLIKSKDFYPGYWWLGWDIETASPYEIKELINLKTEILVALNRHNRKLKP